MRLCIVNEESEAMEQYWEEKDNVLGHELVCSVLPIGNVKEKSLPMKMKTSHDLVVDLSLSTIILFSVVIL